MFYVIFPYICIIKIYLENLDLKNFECIHNFENIYEEGKLISACFLNDNNKIYIITSNDNLDKSDSIKIFDFNGNKIKTINDSNNEVYFIDVFYDNKLSNIFIITCNYGYNKSYEYNENKIFNIYNDKSGYHVSALIINNKEIIKLIESSFDGFIRIWNFHSGELLNKIKLGKCSLIGMCLWNSNYIFIGTSDKIIILLELNNNMIKKELIGHDNQILTIKKTNHPKYGDILISQDEDGIIKLWINQII